jgi:hypothetical protein
MLNRNLRKRVLFLFLSESLSSISRMSVNDSTWVSILKIHSFVDQIRVFLTIRFPTSPEKPIHYHRQYLQL